MRTRLNFIAPLLFLLVTTFAAQAAELPNIVVYLSDDHSQFDSSLYGNKNIPTPNMEALAKDGVMFTHAFVASPSCAPSRAALLTGLMPHSNGAEANHTYPKPSTHSLIEDFKTLGYETAAFGKVAHGKSAPFYGFDHIAYARTIPKLQESVKSFLVKRDRAVPLCLFVGTNNPHVPWTSPTTFDVDELEFPPHQLDTPATRAHRAAYYQEIKELDHFLGRLRHMADIHLGPNVLLLHTSDHGSQWPFGKWNLYDYGIRVPLIASWPGKIEKGSTSHAMVSWIDILPTLLEAAGGEVPQGIEGKSFLQALLGRQRDHRNRIFTTHTGDSRKNVYPMRSMRTREWKIIYNVHPEFAHTNHSDLDRKPNAGGYWTEWADAANQDESAKAIIDRYFRRPKWEMFNVSNDKWELTNLANEPQYRSKFNTLKAELLNWLTEEGDDILVNNRPRLLSTPEDWDPNYFQPPAPPANQKPGNTRQPPQ